MVRLFIGIFIPENLKDKTVSIQNELSRLPIKCKFVERENLHISLSFVGEVSDSEAEKIAAKLDSICATYKKFEVRISDVKLIPSKNYVRVIALDVFNGVLKTISKHIEQEIGGDVKPPHLTLCRVKSVVDKNAFLEKMPLIDFSVGSFLVQSIHTIQSKLQKTGPVYTGLHESFLG